MSPRPEPDSPFSCDIDNAVDALREMGSDLLADSVRTQDTWASWASWRIEQLLAERDEMQNEIRFIYAEKDRVYEENDRLEDRITELEEVAAKKQRQIESLGRRLALEFEERYPLTEKAELVAENDRLRAELEAMRAVVGRRVVELHCSNCGAIWTADHPAACPAPVGDGATHVTPSTPRGNENGVTVGPAGDGEEER